MSTIMNTDRVLLNTKYDGGDTAIQEFYNAVLDLSNYIYDGMGGITHAAYYMSHVSEDLAPANRNLSSGWYEASSFCRQLDAKLQGILETLVVEMNRYVENMKSTEYAAQKAVVEANKVTKDLIDELNGI